MSNINKVKVNYSIRPAKQVERRLIINSYNQLRECWYKISNYQYIWFGSVFYVDFILFHKFLWISNMTCFEQMKIPNRMEFNKPYDFINVINWSFTDNYNSLDFTKESLIWLDYENGLTEEIVSDFEDIISNNIVNWSIITLTLHCFLPWWKEARQDYLGKFESLIKIYSEKEIKDITKKNLSKVYSEILIWKLNDIFLNKDDNLWFKTLYNFIYKDWATMMTIWFIFDEKPKLKTLSSNNVVLSSDQQCISKNIEVPIITNREKNYIDWNLKEIKDDYNFLISKIEIKEKDLKNYIEFYKEYPSFWEIFY